ncbi:helix-turn-helix domain-containing protein [Micromonospora coerulea]|uniref:helix-turn-helix domain-containing protein n=1 Tax=Micromonospora coerulea TaxID=47856 RepID=UPI001906FD32|nr:AraC family transcriptional regulator [Micromonospora veneta]
MYRQVPAAGIREAVVWHSVATGGSPTRVLPDGCLDLLWSSRAGLLVAGPDRTAHLSASSPGERWVGLRLPPGTGPAVLGVPADALLDRRVALADVWGAGTAELMDRIDAARSSAGPARRPPDDPIGPDVERIGAALTAVALTRLRAAGGPDPLGARIAARLATGGPIAATAAEVGLGERALRRRCQPLFGYGPKTLARILRMRRALALARAGTPLAEVAARAGYADQAHLTREVRDLAGVPPTRLLSG